MQILCGIDIGGTFTDLYYCDEQGKILIAKTPTTPENPEIGFINIFEENNIDTKNVTNIVHGTTLSTNAMIEKKYPTLALITTKGFKDIIEIGRYHKEELYNFNQIKERPLVRRKYSYEIDERVDSTGNIIKKFSEEEAKTIAEKIQKEKIKDIAICFLNSYANKENEMKMRSILLSSDPNINCSISSEVLPKLGELGRLVTTLTNVALKEIIDTYIISLEKKLVEKGFNGKLWLMQSNGGAVIASEGSNFGEKTLLSGPAGGAIGASYIGRRSGLNKLITLDIGGTSADMAIIEDAVPLITDTKELGWDMPLPIPMVDVNTIGAGGGSIAWIDDQGIPKVGPKSAGANPGPVFYALGNDQPTLSDAAMVLGHLNKNYYAGKETSLDLNASIKAVKTFGEKIGFDTYKAAKGIIDIINVNTGNAIKEILIKKGKDPRDYTLFAFGGAGPVFASAIARELSIPKVFVSPFSGVFSAFGLLCGGVKHDTFRSFYLSTRDAEPEGIENQLTEMKAEIVNLLEKEGFTDDAMEIERFVRFRYQGQNYDIEVPIKNILIDKEDIFNLEKEYIKRHKSIYGVEIPNTPTAIMGLRVTGTGLLPKPPLPSFKDMLIKNSKNAKIIKEQREVYFLNQEGPVKTDIYDGNLIFELKKEIAGPAIIEYPTTTVVIEPNSIARIDKYSNIIIEIGGRT